MMTFITRRGEGQGKTKKAKKATKSKGRGLEEGASRALMRQDGEDVVREVKGIEKMSRLGGEGQGKTKKERKATKSKGRGLEKGASRALMRQYGEEGCGERG